MYQLRELVGEKLEKRIKANSTANNALRKHSFTSSSRYKPYNKHTIHAYSKNYNDPCTTNLDAGGRGGTTCRMNKLNRDEKYRKLTTGKNLCGHHNTGQGHGKFPDRRFSELLYYLAGNYI